MTIPLETLADGLLVAPQPRRLPPAALFGESIVEGREALGTRDGDQEVPPDEADQSLDLALVVALARPAEPVLEQIVGLKLREDARSLPLPIAQDPGNRQLGVVVQDGSGDAAEEGKRRVVAIAECFGRLRRIGRNKATITVGKVEGADSTGRRNTFSLTGLQALVQSFGGSSPSEGLAGPCIERVSNNCEYVRTVYAQIGSFRED